MGPILYPTLYAGPKCATHNLKPVVMMIADTASKCGKETFLSYDDATDVLFDMMFERTGEGFYKAMYDDEDLPEIVCNLLFCENADYLFNEWIKSRCSLFIDNKFETKVWEIEREKMDSAILEGVCSDLGEDAHIKRIYDEYNDRHFDKYGKFYYEA